MDLHKTDADKVSQNIKIGIQGHAASWYSEVFELVFPNINREQANNIWKSQLAKKTESGDRPEED